MIHIRIHYLLSSLADAGLGLLALTISGSKFASMQKLLISNIVTLIAG